MKMIQSVKLWYAVYIMLLVVQCNLITCNAFNVDAVNYILHEGPPDSMFGYNVFLHKEYQLGRVIVGAPRANLRESNVNRTGEIYSCEITDDNLCQVVPFDENVQSYADMLNSYKSESTVSEPSLDSYRNYSITTGGSDNGKSFIAIGMPREAELLGRVRVFSQNMTHLLNITGQQKGANFGYSVCAVDVDGDKLDDLIVGAPMFTGWDSNGKHEIGRIYVLYNTNNRFDEIDTRDGFNSGGKFGLALTTLNDIDLDGYGDFAVGAPYDGPNGRGAVYIFHGSQRGVLAKYSQVIYAEDISENILTTFGFALSGGIDLDINMYPDMVVGAYESNAVVVFKSRPVVVMEASITFETDYKLIQLDDKNCTLQDGSEVACTDISSCLKYNGINLQPSPQPSLDIQVSWVLDSKVNRSTKRIFFLNDERKEIRNMTMTLHHGKSECRKERVYIVDHIRDKLTPLQIEMKFNLLPSGHIPSSRQPNAILQPVLDQNKETVRRDSINIQKNCGPDNICIPDLRLNVEDFTLGSGERLVFDVEITNYGEDAFGAMFFMVFPEGLTYMKIDFARDRCRSCICSWRDAILKCDIGNPLSAGKRATFQVVTSPSPNHEPTSKYDLYMEVNTTNPEVVLTIFDNIIQKSVYLKVETHLSIDGIAIGGIAMDAKIYYNISDYKNITDAMKETDIGPSVRNIYEIRNAGPSTINEAQLFILIPQFTITGDHLMYILEKPETLGNVVCEPSNYVNLLGRRSNGSMKPYMISEASIVSEPTGDATVISRSGTMQPIDDRSKLNDRMQGQSFDFSDIDLEEVLTCNKTQCDIVRCVIGPLEKDKSVLISVRTRLVAETLNKISPTAPMNITTIAIARVTKLPLIGEPMDKPIIRHEVVLTTSPINSLNPIFDPITKK